MAKPAVDVVWPATGHVTEPPPSKKAEGWLGGEQPANQFMNWLFMVLGQWTTYAKNLESTEALTWVLSQIFEKAITLGADFDATEAEAVSPRLIVEPVSSAIADHTLIGKFKDARLFVKGLGSDSAISLTVNATRPANGTDTWAKITSSQPAYMFHVSRDGLSFSSMPATQNAAWTDAFVSGDGTASGWGRQLFFQSEGAAQTTANQQFPLLSRQFATGVTKRGYIGEFKLSTVRNCRLYVVSSDGALSGQSFEVVLGATWDHVNDRWVKDGASTIVKYNLGERGFYAEWEAAGVQGDTFTSFDVTLFDFQFMTTTASGTSDHSRFNLHNATFAMTGTLAADSHDANPPAQTSQANKIGVRNTDKVTAYFASLGAADGNITPLSGYNLSNAADAVSQAADVITVKFGTALADANYEAVITCEFTTADHFFVPQIVGKSASQIQIKALHVNITGAPAFSTADLNTLAVGFNLRISGKQTT